jgi:hypothetical protein
MFRALLSWRSSDNPNACVRGYWSDDNVVIDGFQSAEVGGIPNIISGQLNLPKNVSFYNPKRLCPTIALSAQLSNRTLTLIPSFYFVLGSHETRSPFSNDINFHSFTHRPRTGTLTMLGPHNACFQS